MLSNVTCSEVCWIFCTLVLKEISVSAKFSQLNGHHARATCMLHADTKQANGRCRASVLETQILQADMLKATGIHAWQTAEGSH